MSEYHPGGLLACYTWRLHYRAYYTLFIFMGKYSGIVKYDMDFSIICCQITCESTLQIKNVPLSHKIHGGVHSLVKVLQIFSYSWIASLLTAQVSIVISCHKQAISKIICFLRYCSTKITWSIFIHLTGAVTKNAQDQYLWF